MAGHMLHDKEGNWSSKRVNGSAMILTGLALAVTNIWIKEAIVVEMLWPVFVTGAALLGASVAERRR